MRGGVIPDMFTWRNVSVPRTLNCWLWECNPIILPQEFTSTIIISVYVPPPADAAVACDVIHSAVAQMQTQHPNAFIVITGNFNHISLDKILPTLHQYVDWHTRDYITLDLLLCKCYAKESTNWDVLVEPHGEGLDSMTDRIHQVLWTHHQANLNCMLLP